MRSNVIRKLGVVVACAALMAAMPVNHSSTVRSGVGPTLQSIGTLTFGANGVFFAADPQGATIFSLELASAPKGAPGTKAIAGIDAQIAAMLGTAPAEITISDLAVDPVSHNSYLAVTRGQGTDAKPVLMRVDGAGKLDVISLEATKFSSVSIPNAPNANPGARNNPRTQSVTDMAFQNGKLYVAGLSNEEFASKLWSVPVPFAAADRGTSVEIWHGSHGDLETRSPVYTFIPYSIDNQPYLIGGYLCTPLVKFPVSSLTPGAKVRGTTIAELGAGNRPIDMIVYKKDGKEFLLMSNTARGVMKIPTAGFASAAPITTPIQGTAGIGYETIATMTGIQQLDLLDATHAVVITKTTAGPLNLNAVILP